MTRGSEDPRDASSGDDGSRAGENLTARTVSGVRWVYAKSAVGQALTLVSAAVLARLLPPRAFGLVAMAALAMTFVKYFAEMGLTRALVQRPDLTKAHVRAGFTSSLALGIVAFGGVWLMAPLAAVVFDEPDVVPVLRLMGLALVLAAMGMAANAMMDRWMAFRALAVRSILSNVLGLVVAIVLALRGFGVYALVIASLASVASNSVLSYVYVRHDLRPTFRLAPYRDLFSYGSRTSVIKFLEFFGHDLDTVLIGRWAGAGPLGLYNRADLIVRLPSQTVARNLSSVLFPVFSSIQDQVTRLRRAYLQAIEMTAAIVVPLCAGLAVAAPEVIEVVLGPQWTEAAPLVPFLALAAAAQVIAHFGGVLCDARAMLNEKIVLTVAKVALLAFLLLGASAVGELYLFAAAIAVAEVAALVAYTWLSARSLEIGWSRALGVVVRPLLAAAAVAAGIAAVRAGMLGVGAPLFAVFVGEAATGGVVLLVMVRWGPLRTVRDKLLAQLRRADVIATDNRSWRLITTVVGSGPAHEQVR